VIGLTHATVVAISVTAAIGNGALAQSDTRGRCPYRGAVRITRDFIGPLPWHAPVRDLLRACPGASIDSAIFASTPRDDPIRIGITFRFDSVVVQGFVVAPRGHFVDTLALSWWSVTGTATLDGGATTTSPWSVLRSQSDSGTILIRDGLARVSLRPWPNMEFVFKWLAHPIGRFSLQSGRELIPADRVPDSVELTLHPDTATVVRELGCASGGRCRL